MRDICYYINNCILFILIIIIIMVIYNVLVQDSIQQIKNLKTL
jgi:hypothetical protein